MARVTVLRHIFQHGCGGLLRSLGQRRVRFSRWCIWKSLATRGVIKCVKSLLAGEVIQGFPLLGWCYVNEAISKTQLCILIHKAATHRLRSKISKSCKRHFSYNSCALWVLCSANGRHGNVITNRGKPGDDRSTEVYWLTRKLGWKRFVKVNCIAIKLEALLILPQRKTIEFSWLVVCVIARAPPKSLCKLSNTSVSGRCRWTFHPPSAVHTWLSFAL